MDRLDELSVFIAIVDAGGLAEAGRRLRRSPAAVTRSLAALEDRMGVRLIERTTRRLAPTEAGRRLAEDARRLLADYGEIVRAVGADEPLRGRLRITAPVVFGRLHVTPIVVSFLRAYPRISIEMFFSDNNVDLIEEEIDVAARIGPLADSTLLARRAGEVRRLLVASPDYVAAYGAPASVGDLVNHEAIYTSGRPVSIEWRLMEGGRERIIRLTPRLIVNQVEAALSAAREGLGIARALSYQVADDLAAGRLVRLLPCAEPSPWPVHLVASSARHMPARTRAFLDHAAESLKSVGAIRAETPAKG
jgi:DNA-binding transcriptional LysR family regulator